MLVDPGSGRITVALTSRRLGLVLPMLAALAALVAGWIRLLAITPGQAERLAQKAEDALAGPDRLPKLATGFWVLALVLMLWLGAGLGLSWNGSLSDPLSGVLRERVFGQNDQVYAFLLSWSLPALAWLAGNTVLAAAFFSLAYRQELRQQLPHHLAACAWLAFFMLAAAAMLAQWAILLLRLDVFALIPGYYWDFRPRELGARAWLLLVPVLLGLAAAAVAVSSRLSRRGVWQAALLILLAYLLQVSFGFVSGGGYDFIRLKYASSLHKSYAAQAAGIEEGLLDILGQYTVRFREKMFTDTKPPGVLLSYMLARRVADRLPDLGGGQEEFVRLTAFIARVYPLLSFWVLGVIALFYRRYMNPDPGGGSSDGWGIAALLYLTAPNVILIPLFLDQVLYPLLFLSGMWLIMYTFERKSFILGAVGGAAFYLLMFMHFSMIMLVPFAAIYAALQLWITRRDLRRSLLLLLEIAAVALAAWLGFKFLFNYDLISQFQYTMSRINFTDYYLKVGNLASYGQPIPFTQRIQQVLEALPANNLEYAMAIGIPLYSLFIFQGVRMAVQLARGAWQRDPAAAQAALPAAAMFLTFVAMNLYGQVRGEVARLWLLWVPAAALIAAPAARRLLEKKPLAFYLLIAAQLITMVLTFWVQDYQV